MRLRYFSMSKVATRVWLFVLLASFAVPVMHIFFPYLDTSNYYWVEQKLNEIAAAQNATAQQAVELGKAVAGDQSLMERFAAFLTLTPIGLSIRVVLMVLENITTGLYPIWVMFGFDKIKTQAGVSLATVLSTVIWVLYAWTFISIITGREE